MKASGIPNHEASFQATGLDTFGKKFILKKETVLIKGSDETIDIMDCARDNGDKSFFYEFVATKRKIVLHFTMGYLKGDIGVLTRQHVSVPFVIGRNGVIYNLFASKFWSYHLGPGAAGGNTAMSKESIGIEISNIGPLKLVGNQLVTSYSNTDVYCSLDETQYYRKLDQPYRGFQYYATFTDAQYISVIKLLRFLTAKYNIPRVFPDLPIRYSKMNDADFTAYHGITSHVNCRQDKTDIGPAFEWERIISGVNL
jgi:N-acetyl-anhydromuramyl-L-alanine amidase AmpD